MPLNSYQTAYATHCHLAQEINAFLDEQPRRVSRWRAHEIAVLAVVRECGVDFLGWVSPEKIPQAIAVVRALRKTGV